jgi:hypothetical protein
MRCLYLKVWTNSLQLHICSYKGNSPVQDQKIFVPVIQRIFAIKILKTNIYLRISRFQWPRGLMRRITARLLRSWVRIPLGAWMFVLCVCCQVEVSATSWSLVQRSATYCGASLCVIKKPRERGGHSPRWAAEPQKIIINNIYVLRIYYGWVWSTPKVCWTIRTKIRFVY